MSKFEELKVRLEKQRKITRLFAATPEAQHQAELFTSWVALGGIGTPQKSPDYHYYWCPKCKKWEKIMFACGLTIEEAIKQLAEEIPKHATEKVSPVHKKIREDYK